MTSAIRATVLAAALALTAGPAHAQPRADATYEVSYQKVADDCAGQGMTMERGQVTVRQQGDEVKVEIAGDGTLTGTHAANGRFKAQGNGAPRGDLASRLSVSGRASGAQIQLIFIAEFHRDKKPVCTQSWSGKGKRR